MRITPRPSLPALYSLHDRRVGGYAYTGGSLRLYMEDGLLRIGPPSLLVPGYIDFSLVDEDFCCAYVLDFCGNQGPFTGIKYSLPAFLAAYGGTPFEIVDETYGYRQTRLAGYLSIDERLCECFLEIAHAGPLLYTTFD